ncbi:MAG: hypothetical protein ACYTEQ_01345 [Planctomycetota bacterium]|jgi:hypothetical protein
MMEGFRLLYRLDYIIDGLPGTEDGFALQAGGGINFAQVHAVDTDSSGNTETVSLLFTASSPDKLAMTGSFSPGDPFGTPATSGGFFSSIQVGDAIRTRDSSNNVLSEQWIKSVDSWDSSSVTVTVSGPVQIDDGVTTIEVLKPEYRPAYPALVDKVDRRLWFARQTTNLDFAELEDDATLLFPGRVAWPVEDSETLQGTFKAVLFGPVSGTHDLTSDILAGFPGNDILMMLNDDKVSGTFKTEIDLSNGTAPAGDWETLQVTFWGEDPNQTTPASTSDAISQTSCKHAIMGSKDWGYGSYASAFPASTAAKGIDAKSNGDWFCENLRETDPAPDLDNFQAWCNNSECPLFDPFVWSWDYRDALTKFWLANGVILRQLMAGAPYWTIERELFASLLYHIMGDRISFDARGLYFKNKKQWKGGTALFKTGNVVNGFDEFKTWGQLVQDDSPNEHDAVGLWALVRAALEAKIDPGGGASSVSRQLAARAFGGVSHTPGFEFEGGIPRRIGEVPLTEYPTLDIAGDPRWSRQARYTSRLFNTDSFTDQVLEYEESSLDLRSSTTELTTGGFEYDIVWTISRTVSTPGDNPEGDVIVNNVRVLSSALLGSGNSKRIQLRFTLGTMLFAFASAPQSYGTVIATVAGNVVKPDVVVESSNPSSAVNIGDRQRGLYPGDRVEILDGGGQPTGIAAVCTGARAFDGPAVTGSFEVTPPTETISGSLFGAFIPTFIEGHFSTEIPEGFTLQDTGTDGPIEYRNNAGDLWVPDTKHGIIEISFPGISTPIAWPTVPVTSKVDRSQNDPGDPATVRVSPPLTGYNESETYPPSSNPIGVKEWQEYDPAVTGDADYGNGPTRLVRSVVKNAIDQYIASGPSYDPNILKVNWKFEYDFDDVDHSETGVSILGGNGDFSVAIPGLELPTEPDFSKGWVLEVLDAQAGTWEVVDTSSWTVTKETGTDRELQLPGVDEIKWYENGAGTRFYVSFGPAYWGSEIRITYTTAGTAYTLNVTAPTGPGISGFLAANYNKSDVGTLAIPENTVDGERFADWLANEGPFDGSQSVRIIRNTVSPPGLDMDGAATGFAPVIKLAGDDDSLTTLVTGTNYKYSPVEGKAYIKSSTLSLTPGVEYNFYLDGWVYDDQLTLSMTDANRALDAANTLIENAYWPYGNLTTGANNLFLSAFVPITPPPGASPLIEWSVDHTDPDFYDYTKEEFFGSADFEPQTVADNNNSEYLIGFTAPGGGGAGSIGTSITMDFELPNSDQVDLTVDVEMADVGLGRLGRVSPNEIVEAVVDVSVVQPSTDIDDKEWNWDGDLGQYILTDHSINDKLEPPDIAMTLCRLSAPDVNGFQTISQYDFGGLSPSFTETSPGSKIWHATTDCTDAVIEMLENPPSDGGRVVWLFLGQEIEDILEEEDIAFAVGKSWTTAIERVSDETGFDLHIRWGAIRFTYQAFTITGLKIRLDKDGVKDNAPAYHNTTAGHDSALQLGD